MKLPALHHHLYGRSSFAVGAEFAKRFGGDAFSLLNSLEDVRIEEVMSRAYPGSGVNLANAYRFAVKVAREQRAVGKTMTPIKQLAFAIASRARGESDLPFIEPSIYGLADLIEGEIRGAVTARNTQAVARLAESAWRTVEPHLRAMSSSDHDNNKETNSAVEPNGTPGTDKQDASAGGENAPASPSAEAGGMSAKKRKMAASSSTSSSMPSSKVAPPASDPGGSAPAGVVGDPTGTDAATPVNGVLGELGGAIADAVSRYAETNGAYRVWSTEHDKIVVPDGNTYPSHADRMASLMPHVAGVRQHLLQALMAETRARWLPDQEEGRHLNPRALHRIASARLVPNGGTEAARRIFRTRVAVRRLATAVTLLVDLSHSMANRKIDLARNAALVLCEALTRLDIPVSVIGFSTQHPNTRARTIAQQSGIPVGELEKSYRLAPLVHEFYKRFDEPFRAVSGRFEKMKALMLTPLGESLLFAARTLARRDEPRKVLMALTDGRPTVGLSDDDATFRHAKDSIARIERAGVEVLLVGILENCVADLHHRSVVVNTLDDLPRTVMRQMRQLLSHTHRPPVRYAHVA